MIDPSTLTPTALGTIGVLAIVVALIVQALKQVISPKVKPWLPWIAALFALLILLGVHWTNVLPTIGDVTVYVVQALLVGFTASGVYQATANLASDVAKGKGA